MFFIIKSSLSMSNKRRLMREVNEMMIAGDLHPISPLKTFDVSDLESALLYFSQGEHIGKVAVTYAAEETPLKVSTLLRSGGKRLKFDRLSHKSPWPDSTLRVSTSWSAEPEGGAWASYR